MSQLFENAEIIPYRRGPVLWSIAIRCGPHRYYWLLEDGAFASPLQDGHDIASFPTECEAMAAAYRAIDLASGKAKEMRRRIHVPAF